MLRKRTKLAYGLGDHTITYALSALSLFYVFFLTEHAELRPALAGLVPLLGRFVDAVTDPLMGRISDVTRTRFGRRRPYFLAGAIPFGLSFALLWTDTPGLDSQLGKFAVYSLLYIAYSVCSTIVAVPYVSLLPELARSYEERTSLASYRSGMAVAGTLLAATATRPAVEAMGGGPTGWALTGLAFGAWIALPWLLVYAATYEQPATPPTRTTLRQGFALLFAHKTYRRLSWIYLFGRMAMDLGGAMFIYYFDFWLRRPGDYPWTLAALLCTSIASLPFWIQVGHRTDKHRALIGGSLWWMVLSLLLLVAQPDWPRPLIFAFAGLVGVGYAVVDMMPWSMLGDVVDEDELRTGERREGLYSGSFTFLRKLAGAGGVALAGVVLDLAGYRPGAEQSESALLAIRVLTGLSPALLLAVAVTLAAGYPLTRARHRRIRAELDAAAAARGRSAD